MNEKLIHFIWRYQYFNKSELLTTKAEKIEILDPGSINTNQGPDFLSAKIRINEIIWFGSVEIHILSSDWFKHKHQTDSKYDPIILHIVWEEDKIIFDKYGNILPTLVIGHLISKWTLEKYKVLMNNQTNKIPCHALIHKIDIIVWAFWKERLLIERLERKSKIIIEKLDHHKLNWEKITWILIAKQLAGPVNADCFEQIIENLDFNIFQKNKHDVFTIESLLFGQANLLDSESKHEYCQYLYKEYIFYCKKYKIIKIKNQPLFLRMRPASFPTFRLSQLAQLLTKKNNIFSEIRDYTKFSNLKNAFIVEASEYWHNHYVMDGVEVQSTPFKIGEDLISRLLINVAVPILFTIGVYYNDHKFKMKALHLLENIFPENNKITRLWTKDKVNIDTAWDSQAIIELNNEYCTNKKCLSCSIGVEILKNKNE